MCCNSKSYILTKIRNQFGYPGHFRYTFIKSKWKSEFYSLKYVAQFTNVQGMGMFPRVLLLVMQIYFFVSFIYIETFAGPVANN